MNAWLPLTLLPPPATHALALVHQLRHLAPCAAWVAWFLVLLWSRWILLQILLRAEYGQGLQWMRHWHGAGFYFEYQIGHWKGQSTRLAQTWRWHWWWDRDELNLHPGWHQVRHRLESLYSLWRFCAQYARGHILREIQDVEIRGNLCQLDDTPAPSFALGSHQRPHSLCL